MATSQPTSTQSGQIIEIYNSRKTIIDYYVTCETDFTKGVKLYETIVETQIGITTGSQLTSLENTKRELIHSTNTPFSS